MKNPNPSRVPVLRCATIACCLALFPALTVQGFSPLPVSPLTIAPNPTTPRRAPQTAVQDLGSSAIGNQLSGNQLSGNQLPGNQVPGNQEPNEAQQLEAEQKQLADKYKLLEEKLFSLHEFEKDSNPVRSKLLERAFLQSQEKMTAMQMQLIVKLLTKTKLKDAEQEQEQVLAQLQQLLNLLQSEDRGKRVRDEIQRHQDYLKDVERILRIQKGIRGQTEGGVDAKRLANSEQNAADRTAKLADQIRENETDPDDDQASGSESERGEEADNPDTDPSQDDESATPEGEPGANSDSPDGRPSEKSDPDHAPSDTPIPESPPQPSDSGQPGQPGQPGQSGGAPGDSGAPSDAPPSQQPPSDETQDGQNPVQKRVEAAEKKMRDAQQKLEQAQRDEAIEAMRQAEREMALAKKELEEILRQLREEEIERTLAMLEGRFRQMLEREVRVHESTRQLDTIVPEQRGTDFEIRAGKLAVEQKAIAADAARALLLLREDGSSVAFPATVDEMHQDMLQVASRLSSAKTGQITLEIEEDVIDTLDYLVEALVKTQQDMERKKQQGKQNASQGQPGDEPLVDKLAEIKMLRGLQERILRRHRRYSQFLEDPNDPIGSTDDPDLQSALQRLADKQAQLTKIARDIVNEKNK